MKVSLDPKIANISGRCGDVLYKTFKRADGTKETRAYFLPRRSNGKYGYERRTKPSKAELGARAKFAKVSHLIKNMPESRKMEYHSEWVNARYKFRGKKYCTLRGYIAARLYADMKDGVDISSDSY